VLVRDAAVQHPLRAGLPAAHAPPTGTGSTYQEAHSLWDLEVALDVEWSHATAPLANIILVTTPTAETLGVQGLAQMMNAEKFVIDNHMADVITQSFGAGEGSFHNGLAAIMQLRQVFLDAQANDVTVFASSGDTGTADTYKEPVKKPATIPYPTVSWPNSDPLVTSVGGTYLCTDATTGSTVDSTSPPAACQNNPGVREVGWVGSGGGYSILFPKPSYQDVLPPGSTFVGSSAGAPGPNTNMRGFHDITVGCNTQTSTSIPGYCASQGWDAVTGLGTPDVANLIPDLEAATQ
jgi:subtilase family serine protease